MMVKNKGFTLIELLVVISVIGLLMGILLPALGKAKAASQRTYCASNLRQIGVAFRAYLDDHRDIMPSACAYPWIITDATNPDYRPPITKFLSPLLNSPKVFICRADIAKYYSRTGNTSYYYNGRQQLPFGWVDGLSGLAIAASHQAQEGLKAKNIDVMSDFDAVHSGISGTWTNKAGTKRAGKKNYLYADWHVGNYENQD